jgi:DNA-binding response OmpR family regulator
MAAFPRVLVIDDEADMRELLEYGLGCAGFDVRTAPDGRAALHVMQQWTPEAVVLDVMLPGIDGFALLPALRRVTDVPIIMLTARFQTSDKVDGFFRGADDYMAKPFEMDELVARLHARLRRPHLESRETLSYADIVIDLSSRSVVRANRPIELSAREFDLLVTLMRNAERVLSRDQLLDLVWGQDRDVAPATVETYISYLRSKIERPGEATLIQTIRGVGYSLRPEAK